jgi:hypothetical protein
MSASNFAQTEKAHGLKPGELKAIFWYSDRSYTKIVLFAINQTVARAIQQYFPKTSVVESKTAADLPKALFPIDEGYVHDDRKYGLKDNGLVMSISGTPPKAG